MLSLHPFAVALSIGYITSDFLSLRLEFNVVFRLPLPPHLLWVVTRSDSRAPEMTVSAVEAGADVLLLLCAAPHLVADVTANLNSIPRRTGHCSCDLFGVCRSCTVRGLAGALPLLLPHWTDTERQILVQSVLPALAPLLRAPPVQVCEAHRGASLVSGPAAVCNLVLRAAMTGMRGERALSSLCYELYGRDLEQRETYVYQRCVSTLADERVACEAHSKEGYVGSGLACLRVCSYLLLCVVVKWTNVRRLDPSVVCSQGTSPVAFYPNDGF